MQYPEYIALEITNHCFMKCIHCPHGHDLIKHKGFMSWKCFQKIIDQVAFWPNKPEIILYGNGEPFLHKKIVSFVSYATEKGLSTNLSTNISLATPEKADQLSTAGLTLIKLSFWGDTQQEYESRTRNQSFSNALGKAHAFIKASSPDMKIVVNIVKFRTTNSSLEPNPDFMEQFKDYENVEFYSFYGSDWRGTLDIPELKVPLKGAVNPSPCHLAGDMITIAWDGFYSLCWLDYGRNLKFEDGHVYSMDLIEFWNSPERNKYLNMMYDGRFCEIELCRFCSAPYSEIKKARFYKNNKISGVCKGVHIFSSNFPTNKSSI